MSLLERRRRRRRAAIVLVGGPALVVTLGLVSFAMTNDPARRYETPPTLRTPSVDRDGFALGGTVATPLRPGSTSAVDVRIANHRDDTLIVWDLVVAVTDVDAPRATAALPCSARDFRVAQMSEPVAVEANSSLTLAGLGWGEGRWPQITMVDAEHDQDGCVEAELTLDFRARGMGPE